MFENPGGVGVGGTAPAADTHRYSTLLLVQQHRTVARQHYCTCKLVSGLNLKPVCYYINQLGYAASL